MYIKAADGSCKLFMSIWTRDPSPATGPDEDSDIKHHLSEQNSSDGTKTSLSVAAH